MKTILVAVVGTVGLLATPAVAGSPKKPRKAEVAKPVAVAEASVADAGVAKAIAEVAPSSSPELLAIPVLPADTSTALTPFADLEKARPLPAPLKMGKPKKEAAPAMKLGNDYVLGGKRQSAKPTEEVQQIVPKGLSRAQVSTYIDAHAGDIQLCWDKIPAKQRAEACTASLQLTIADAGTVTDIEIGGDVPTTAHACIVHAVSHWQFPVAETSTETEYGISLRSR